MVDHFFAGSGTDVASFPEIEFAASAMSDKGLAFVAVSWLKVLSISA